MVDGASVPVLLDMDGKAHGAYGLEARLALLLVHPDGQIAFRCNADWGDHWRPTVG